MMPSESAQPALRNRWLLLALWSLLAIGGPLGAAAPDGRGQRVLQLYERVLMVGEALLEFEQVVLQRLERQRPVDVARAVARFRSARDQMKRLRKMARKMEKELPPGEPTLPAIEKWKARIPEFRTAHRSNMQRIKTLAPAEVSASGETVDEAWASDLEPDESEFPVRTVEEQF